MKLDRNIPGNLGRGKYALIKLRILDQLLDFGAGASIARINVALGTLTEFGMARLRRNASDGILRHAR